MERDFTDSFHCTLLKDFNSHAHVERDYCRQSISFFYNIFQLTRSRGAWHISSSNSNTCSIFQLTRSRGAWQASFIGQLSALLHFNSHAHVERDLSKLSLFPLQYHFNSHAHVERDEESGRNTTVFLISTHTLTWSVTFARLGHITFFIFQLTRSRGAWPYWIRFILA